MPRWPWRHERYAEVNRQLDQALDELRAAVEKMNAKAEEAEREQRRDDRTKP